jgi:acid phosphatase type 7
MLPAIPISRSPGLVVAASVLVAAATLAMPGDRATAGASCFGQAPTQQGTAGPDVLVGTPGPDVLVGRGGPDRLVGLSGADRLCGGAGTDRLEGRLGGDRLAGGAEDDTLVGGSGINLLQGGSGSDACFQGADGRTTDCAPTIAAGGDIACSPNDDDYNGGNGTATRCRMRWVSDLMVGSELAAVLAVGDEQYPRGELEHFQASYDPTWGRVKAITHPVPGNHEYGTPGAAGYFSYFGTAAGDPSEGYYSVDVGSWHLVALNSGDCYGAVPCGVGSAQEQWLRADLAADDAACTLAFAHHPRFSSGLYGGFSRVRPFWRALYEDGAELFVAGHDHDYERFAPQAPGGDADPAGIREFVVGTGGASLRTFQEVQPNSEERLLRFGVLELSLQESAYTWAFISEDGRLRDFGSAACH